MTGDPTRDAEATPHRWGGSDEIPEDEYAQHQRREAEAARQRSIDNGRALVAQDWLDTISGNRLHYATLTDQQAADMDDYRQLGHVSEGTDGRFALACGRQVTYITIPGVLTRMGRARCSRCCDVTGLPRGIGSPKNDPACREGLGMGKEGGDE